MAAGKRPAKLTERERRFVEAYMGPAAGNGTKAAQMAGYGKNANTSHALASRLLRKVTVAAAIAERVERAEKAAVADRQERQEFYTETMRAAELDRKDRLKAAELLGKTQGDFVQKVEVEHAGQVRVVRVPDRAKSAAEWEGAKK